MSESREQENVDPCKQNHRISVCKQDNSKMIQSLKGGRKPYSFGDPRQLPSVFSTSQNEKTGRYSPAFSKQTSHDLCNEFEPIIYENHMQRTQCPIYCNAWAHDEMEELYGGLKCINGVEAEFQRIQPPTDYASMFVKETGDIYEHPILKPNGSVKNDYVLWPMNTTNEPIRFSPTRLQHILMGRDVARNSCSKWVNKEESSERNARKEAIPVKRKLLDNDEKANTPELQTKKSNSRAMHCVRRLFPSNMDSNCSPKDSESDSEFCRNLSQDSSSQSESSDWTTKI